MLYFDMGCFHQPGARVSEDNLFLKSTVHKLGPLSDFLFTYSGRVQTAISLPPPRECSRGFGCLQHKVNRRKSSCCILQENRRYTEVNKEFLVFEESTV